MTEEIGFAEDEQPAEKKKPDEAPSPGFDPFSDQPVQVNHPGQPQAPDSAVKGTTAEARQGDPLAEPEVQVDPAGTGMPMSPLTAAPGGQARRPADPFGAEAIDTGPIGAPTDEADEDVKPGSGRNLWPCPHCGAKNKANRDTCRSCGKSPDEPVVVPWFKKPGVLGAACLLVVVLIAVWMIAGGTDLSLKAPSLANLDEEVRITGSGSPGSVAGKAFTPVAGIALTGRILAADTVMREGVAVHELFIVCGSDPALREPDLDMRFEPEVFDHRIDVRLDNEPAPRGAVDYALVHLLDEGHRLSPQVGDLISFSGSHGQIGDWGLGEDLRDKEYLVLPAKQVLTSTP